jgi:hypothetical protein
VWAMRIPDGGMHDRAERARFQEDPHSRLFLVRRIGRINATPLGRRASG